MIWLTWRQFRVQAVTALAALAALTAFLVVLGVQIRDAYETNVNCGAGCSVEAAQDVLEQEFGTVLILAGFLVILVPALLGAFWGAPLISRELETGTHRLVWNQSISRTRWLAVKLSFVTLAAVAVTGALSLLFTWAASPYDALSGSRFEPMFFPTRNIVPLGYAAFAVVAGIAIGLIARRTVLAMAVTLAAFAVIQILVPTVVRPHLQPPVTESLAFAGNAGVDGFGVNPAGEVTATGFAVPGGWMLTPAAQLYDAAGDPITRDQVQPCFTGEFRDDMTCLEAMDMRLTLSYHPADRYWTFQWLELSVYLLLAGLLAGFTWWRIRRSLN